MKHKVVEMLNKDIDIEVEVEEENLKKIMNSISEDFEKTEGELSTDNEDDE